MASESIDTFWTLLGQLRHRLAKAWGQDEDYRWLFHTDPEFRERFYSYFGISGAAVAVANPLLKRFVLLQQEGHEGASDLTTELPFCAQRKGVGAHFGLPSEAIQTQFSRTIHELFILHRQGQALESAQDSTRQQLSPEFLQYLSQGLEPLTTPALDYYKCDVGEVMLYVALWRWALYLLSRRATLHEDLTTATFESVWNAPKQSPGDIYCDAAFFGDDVDIAESLPEAWMLARPSPTHQQPSLLRALRAKCDSISDSNSFLLDCQLLQLCEADGTLTAVGNKAWASLRKKKQPPRDIKDFARELHAYCCRQNESKTIISLLRWVHKEARFPIIPYFYLMVLDGPKEHLVIPIHRSEECAVWRNDTERTTVVAVALFSLTYSPHSAPEPGRIQQLEVFTRILAERLMAKVFYGGIQRELSRQEGEERRTRITLHDLDWATGALLTHFNELPETCQAASVYLEFLRRFLKAASVGQTEQLSKGPWAVFSSWFDPGPGRTFDKLFEHTLLAGYYRALPRNGVPCNKVGADGRQVEWACSALWAHRQDWIQWECNLPDSWLEKVAQTAEHRTEVQFWVLSFLISAQMHSLFYAFRRQNAFSDWKRDTTRIRKGHIRVRADLSGSPRRIFVSNIGNRPDHGGQSVSEIVPGDHREHSTQIISRSKESGHSVQVDDFSPSSPVGPQDSIWWQAVINVLEPQE
jgi:hypothetical protein